MPSYRFCRPDDIPLLVRALNECYDVHFPEQAAVTLDSFMLDIRHYNLWSSSCMIAQESERLIGVCIGCKRKQQTLIYKIGVHPDFQNQGHATHMLTSLSAKLAVLGPPEIVTELRQNQSTAAKLFGKLGYQQKGVYTDYKIDSELEPIKQVDALGECQLSEVDTELLKSDENNISWFCRSDSITNMSNSIKVVALASSTRIESFLLLKEEPSGEMSILRAAATSNIKPETALPILCRYAKQLYNCTLLLPKCSSKEHRNSITSTNIAKGQENYINLNHHPSPA